MTLDYETWLRAEWARVGELGLTPAQEWQAVAASAKAWRARAGVLGGCAFCSGTVLGHDDGCARSER